MLSSFNYSISAELKMKMGSYDVSLSIVGALLFSVFFSLLGFHFGYTISTAHILTFPLAFVGCMILQQGPLLSQKKTWGYLFVELVLIVSWIILSILVASHTYGINFDGLAMHSEFVQALVAGWNPVKDPTFTSDSMLNLPDYSIFSKRLESGGYYLKYGPLLGSLFAKNFGFESAKAINWLYLYFLIRSLVPLTRSLGLNGWRMWMAITLCIGNPVLVYQMLSHWHDGLVACLLTILLLAGIVIITACRLKAVVLFFLTCVLLMGSKKAGLGYSIIFGGSLSFILLLRHLRTVPKKWLAVAGLVVVVGGFFTTSFVKTFTFGRVFLPDWEDVGSVSNLDHRIGQEVADKYPKYVEIGAFEQFVIGSFAQTSVVPVAPVFKWVGTVSKSEWYWMSQSFTGYWSGGFGPLFGLSLILGVGVLLLSVIQRRRVEHLSFPLLVFLITLAILPCLFSRWIPHLWMLPFLFLFGSDFGESKDRFSGIFNLRKRSGIYSFLKFVTLAAVGLNSFLFLWGTVIGQFHSQRILTYQLELLAQIEEPVGVQFGWFDSNRFWLREKGIDYKDDVSNESQNHAIVTLYRTNTKIFLDQEVSSVEVIDPSSGNTVSLLTALENLSQMCQELYGTHPWLTQLVIREQYQHSDH